MKAAVLLLILFLACTTCVVANAYKILLVFPITARSHYILGNALARGLAEAGHDVTMVSPFSEKNPPKNGSYRDIVLTGHLEQREKGDRNMFEMAEMNPYKMLFFINYMGTIITEQFFNHSNVQQLLKSNETFDIVILQQFVDDALKVLAYHFSAPLILFGPVGANGWVNSFVANPSPYSYIPDLLLNFSSRMTFLERVQNTVFNIFSELNKQILFFPSQNRLMKQYFPGAPDLSILNYNTSLVLLNAHVSINQPVPIVPSMVNIGGFHVQPPKKLPKDLQEVLDNAKEGVIYFSMGSNLKSKHMPVEKRDAILKTFGKLREKVLWKWEDDTLPGKPDNLVISKWFPQQDILAHPNVKLFITHGGLLSTTEAIYHGVPVVTIPILGDQKINAATAEVNGYGVNLVYSELTEETLTAAINNILNNPKYGQNAKHRSQVMHDRPVKPMDTAVYWVEYVIRHKGATHLRVEGINLSWYQYLCLDVWAFLVTATIAGNTIIFVIVRGLCCKKRIASKKEVTDKKKTN